MKTPVNNLRAMKMTMSKEATKNQVEIKAMVNMMSMMTMMMSKKTNVRVW
jgi:hypothetical protein